MINDPQVIIASAENAEKILQGMTHHAKSHNYRFLHAWMGNGLLTTKGFDKFILTNEAHFDSIDFDFVQTCNGECTEKV
jgi:hypothetical protein